MTNPSDDTHTDQDSATGVLDPLTGAQFDSHSQHSQDAPKSTTSSPRRRLPPQQQPDRDREASQPSSHSGSSSAAEETSLVPVEATVPATTAAEGSLFPLIPHNKTGNVHEVVAGLTLADFALVLISPMIVFTVATNLLGLSMSWPLVGATLGTGAAFFLIAVYVPHYLKPREVFGRNLAYMRSRLRMPLVGEDARDVPGITDVYWEYDALGRADDTVFGAVRLPPVNTSQHDDANAAARALLLALNYNRKIERSEGTGFDIQLQFAQYGYTPAEIASLEDTTRNPALTEYQRQFAQERAEETYQRLGEEGVMDRSYRIVVPVGPEEGVDLGWLEEKLRQLPITRLTDPQRASQLKLLEQRLSQVEKFAAGAGPYRRLSADELIALQRAHWRGTREHGETDQLDIRATTMEGETVQTPDEVRALQELLDFPPQGDSDSPAATAASNENHTMEENGQSTSTAARGPHAAESQEIDPSEKDEPPASAAPDESPKPEEKIADQEGEASEEPGESALAAEEEISLDHTTGFYPRLKTHLAQTILDWRNRFVRVVTHCHDAVVAHRDGETRRRMYDGLAPAYLDEHRRYVELEHEVVRSVYIVSWPREASLELLDPIAMLPGVNLEGSLYLDAAEWHDKRDELESQTNKIVNEAIFRDIFNASGDSADADDLGSQKASLREYMRNEEREAAEVSATITVRAADHEALSRGMEKLQDVCNAASIDIKDPKRQQLGLRSTAPAADNALFEESAITARYDMVVDTLGCLLSFGGGVRQDPNGVLYGYAKQDAGADAQVIAPLVIDRERLTTPHRWIVGRSGTGKTSGENSDLIEEHIRRPDQKTVIGDIARGFDGLEAVNDGERVVLGETTINIFEYNRPTDTESISPSVAFDHKVELIEALLMIHLKKHGGDDAAELRPTLGDAIRATFARFGFVGETLAADTEVEYERLREHHRDAGVPDRDAILEDLFDTFDQMLDQPEQYVRSHEEYLTGLREDVRQLYRLLKPFENGSGNEQGGKYSFLNGESEANLDADTVIGDMSHFEERGTVERAMLMLVFTSMGYEVAKQTDRLVVFALDEAHTMFADEEEAERLAELVRAGRNYGLVFDFISQATKDFFKGPASIIADQCSVAIWHEVGALDAKLAKEYELTPRQEQLVQSGLLCGDNDAADRSEALVIVENRDAYLIEKKYSRFVQQVIEYKRAKHGSFKAYLDGIPKEAQGEGAGQAPVQASPVASNPAAAIGSVEGAGVESAQAAVGQLRQVLDGGAGSASNSIPDGGQPDDDRAQVRSGTAQRDTGAICGRPKTAGERVGEPCQLDAGWGRDASHGPCLKHFEGNASSSSPGATDATTAESEGDD